MEGVTSTDLYGPGYHRELPASTWYLFFVERPFAFQVSTCAPRLVTLNPKIKRVGEGNVVISRVRLFPLLSQILTLACSDDGDHPDASRDSCSAGRR